MRRAKKALGQHFLHDRTVIDRIVAALGPVADEPVVEIGPGRGALTVPLLEAGARLEVVEFDRDLVPLLRDLAETHPRLRVHHGDALALDLANLVGDAPVRIVGNLPYNISSPLLFHLLGQREHITDMHFMLQREVVDRMTSPPGSRRYGRLSVMVQYSCLAKRLFTVGAGAFVPPPKVESAVVRIVPKKTADPQREEMVDEAVLAQVVRAAFGQRRKTLANALRGILDAAEIEVAGIAPGRRAEQLSVADFVALARQAARPR